MEGDDFPSSGLIVPNKHHHFYRLFKTGISILISIMLSSLIRKKLLGNVYSLGTMHLCALRTFGYGQFMCKKGLFWYYYRPRQQGGLFTCWAAHEENTWATFQPVSRHFVSTHRHDLLPIGGVRNVNFLYPKEAEEFKRSAEPKPNIWPNRSTQ